MLAARSIKSLQDVVDWGMCTGCGACAYLCKRGDIKLVNVENEGIRPQFASAKSAASPELLSVCPGANLQGDLLKHEWTPTAQHTEFGVALEIWEGHATDPEIRHRASSGGLLTALALHCLEHEGMEFVNHIGADEARPWLNRTRASRTRAELLNAAGSRYAPASPCDSLQEIENATAPCVFIGKPCDTAAVMTARRTRPELDAKLGLVLAFFCAGTPSTKATLDLLREMGIGKEQLARLNYRGEGWPGGFKPELNESAQACSGNNPDGEQSKKFIPYETAWAKLATQRPQRCHVCPDGLGRLADLACGDAWEKYSRAPGENGAAGSENPGLSLVLVRTERGREILHRALAAGVITLQRVGVREVLDAQKNLLSRRPQIYGRLLARRLLGIPTPRFDNFGLGHDWLRLPLRIKARTLFGSLRRLVQRSQWRCQQNHEHTTETEAAAVRASEAS